MEIDPLADLGLDPVENTTVTPPAKSQKETKKAGQAKATAKKEAPTSAEPAADDTVAREEVEIGEIEFGFAEFIPAAKRKAEGSKYKFDQLAAPSVWEDGPRKGKPKIANFTVKLQPGVDPDKLRRSVQSATTQANKQNAGAGKYFVSRSLNDENGKFVGMIVYRTDDKNS